MKSQFSNTRKVKIITLTFVLVLSSQYAFMQCQMDYSLFGSQLERVDNPADYDENNSGNDVDEQEFQSTIVGISMDECYTNEEGELICY